MSIDAKDVNRALRATLWPAIKAHGFTVRTDRVAWRYARNDIDVVELQAVGQHAEAIGCPSLSLSVYIAAYPRFLDRKDSIPVRDGRPRPHYWHCDPFRRSMHKTISQPWFRPFSEPLDKRMLLSFRLHREALSRLIDRAVHDVPDIWYMREDGSNLDENLRDLTSVVVSAGMDLLDEFHDPVRVLELIQTGALLNAESPHADDLRETIGGYLARGSGTEVS
jgi:hypothetical protein